MKLIALIVSVQSKADKQIYIVLRQYNLGISIVNGTYKDTINFVVRQSMRGIEKGTRNTVHHNGTYCHIQRHQEPVAAYAFVDKEYPARVAFSLLKKTLDVFLKEAGQGWRNVKKDENITIPEVNKQFVLYQNPSSVDKLTKAQEQIDETKIILHDNIRKLLTNGQDLDELVQRSKDISVGAKKIFTTTQKMQKPCCSLI